MSDQENRSYGPHDLLQYARDSREGREENVCPRCGQMLGDNVQKCPICGEQINRNSTVVENERNKPIGLIWFAVISCVAAVIMLLLFTNSNQKRGNLEDELATMNEKNYTVNAEYKKLKSDYSVLETNLSETKTHAENLQQEYNSLKKEYDGLINDSHGWYQLSDSDRESWVQWTEDEKAAELARAETDRINAEKELQRLKEEEEKKAAEERAEREKKEAEEKAKKEAEEKKGYDTGYTYEDLARRPDDYIGKKVKFKGEVLQVVESSWSNEIQIRLATKKNSWGGYSDNVIYAHFNKNLITERILDEDIITVYGVAEQLTSYTTILGATVTLPQVKVDKIEINK
ncbi:MAG: hypothetical protein IK138_00930 [Lachnospiraceae bacterium]|nr:hypothetical protein [Lachnospiraceae bacterium]